MKRNVFAVCDLEVSYACSFMEYLNHKRNIPFEVRAFTSIEKLCSYAAEQKIELLLISEEAMCEDVKALDIRKIIILSEGMNKDPKAEYPSVYKYQSSDSVVREVMACYGEEVDGKVPVILQKKDTKVIGVYSPVGRCLKTSFALTLGQLLAKNKRTLYVNMEECAGFENLFETHYERTISDLIYDIRQQRENMPLRLGSLVQTIQNLDYIPPAVCADDIRNTSYDEWQELLHILTESTDYEVIVLDIGDGVENLYAMLAACSRIYMPIKTDIMSLSKIQQFENLLRVWDYNTVLERTEKLKLPFHGTMRDSSHYVDQLIWGELGDCVRERIRKDGI